MKLHEVILFSCAIGILIMTLSVWQGYDKLQERIFIQNKVIQELIKTNQNLLDKDTNLNDSNSELLQQLTQCRLLMRRI